MSDIDNWRQVLWRAVPRYAATNIDNKDRSAVLTDGKWGSENTPVVLLSDVPTILADYIVDLHNASL